MYDALKSFAERGPASKAGGAGDQWHCVVANGQRDDEGWLPHTFGSATLLPDFRVVGRGLIAKVGGTREL